MRNSSSIIRTLPAQQCNAIITALTHKNMETCTYVPLAQSGLPQQQQRPPRHHHRPRGGRAGRPARPGGPPARRRGRPAAAGAGALAPLRLRNHHHRQRDRIRRRGRSRAGAHRCRRPVARRRRRRRPRRRWGPPPLRLLRAPYSTKVSSRATRRGAMYGRAEERGTGQFLMI